MNGEQLYVLYALKAREITGGLLPPWDHMSPDRRQIWNEMAAAIAVEFDPSADRAQLVERLESAECVIRQASRDTFGEELSVKEFAEQSGYDS